MFVTSCEMCNRGVKLSVKVFVLEVTERIGFPDIVTSVMSSTGKDDSNTDTLRKVQ